MNQSKIDKVLEKVIKVTSLPHILAIRDGVILVMPATLIGSLFLLIGALPIPGYPEFMSGLFGDGWQAKVLYPVGATFDLMGLVVSLTVAYKLATHYRVDPLGAGIVSLMGFMLVTPFQVLGGNGEIVSAIPIAKMGSQGIFVAILVAFLSTEIFRTAIQRNWAIKMPEGVPEGVSRSFSVLIPGVLVIVTLWLIRLGVEWLGIHSVHDILNYIAQPLASLTGSLGGAVIFILAVHVFWAFGIHGHAIVEPLFLPTMLQLLDGNREAYQNGLDLPNIVMKPFFDTYVQLGGSGATLPFVIAMVLFAKSKQLKSVGRLSLTPGLFQINEPVIFGVPIIFNPVMIIPFILTPVVLTVVTYCAMSWGFLPKPTGIALPWTTPIFISGYLVSGGSFLGVMWQGINFAIATMIWLPFFRVADRVSVD